MPVPEGSGVPGGVRSGPTNQSDKGPGSRGRDSRGVLIGNNIPMRKFHKKEDEFFSKSCPSFTSFTRVYLFCFSLWAVTVGAP